MELPTGTMTALLHSLRLYTTLTLFLKNSSTDLRTTNASIHSEVYYLKVKLKYALILGLKSMP